MKKKLLVVLAILACAMPNGVYAKGTTTVDVTGKNNVIVGEIFTIDVVVKDVVDTYDGVVSFGGRLSFDESKLELVDTKLANAPYQFYMNENTYKLAGLDFTLDNGIYDETVVYTFTFKVIDKGTTTVTINEIVLTDSKDYIDTVTNALSINIKEKTTTTTTTTKPMTTSKQTETSTTKKIEEKQNVIPTGEKSEKQEKKEERQTIISVIRDFIHSIIEGIERLFKRK